MGLRSFVLAASILILSPFSVSGGTAAQTNWSGGGEVLGPVTDWGNEFYEVWNIRFIVPSSLTLDRIFLLTPAEHTVSGEFNGASSVYSADIDDDGDMDVIGAAVGYYGYITWWENADGSGTDWTQHNIDREFYGAFSVHSADVDDDGDMDVLGAAYYDDDITWWENSDTGSGIYWTEHTVDGDCAFAASVYSADVNGDGYMDVLGAARDVDEITWWENTDGTGTAWTEHTVDGDFDGAYSVYSADVDGDGYMDMLGAAYNDDDITWWENTDGSGTAWTEHTVDGDFNGAFSVYSADVDGDGDMDVLGAAGTADDLTWWENTDGTGTAWTEHTVDGDFDAAFSVYSADVDGDGDMDVLGAAYNDDDITWWENTDGSGTAWIEHTVDGDFKAARSVYSADVNGDGFMDVLGAAALDDDITWWNLRGDYYANGYLTSSILDADLAANDSWTYLNWSSTEPAGTSIGFRVRASDDSSNMGAWSSSHTSPCSLSTILSNGDRYFQYRVSFETLYPAYAPTLHDVTVEWTESVATEEGSGTVISSYTLYGARPNPGFGHTTIIFSLPMDSMADLTVYDLAGRTVHSVSDDYSAGIHEVILEGLASGMYLVRLTSADFTATVNVVMIE